MKVKIFDEKDEAIDEVPSIVEMRIDFLKLRISMLSNEGKHHEVFERKLLTSDYIIVEDDKL